MRLQTRLELYCEVWKVNALETGAALNAGDGWDAVLGVWDDAGNSTSLNRSDREARFPEKPGMDLCTFLIESLDGLTSLGHVVRAAALCECWADLADGGRTQILLLLGRERARIETVCWTALLFRQQDGAIRHGEWQKWHGVDAWRADLAVAIGSGHKEKQ